MISNIHFLIIAIIVFGIVISSFINWIRDKENRRNSFFSLAQILLSVIFGLCNLMAGINPQYLAQEIMPELKDIIQENIKLNEQIDDLEGANRELTIQNDKLNEQIDNWEETKNIDQSNQKADMKNVNLLEGAYFNQSESNSFWGFTDVDGGKDNAGVVHGKGFIYVGNYYHVGYRTYRINGLYETITGTIAIPFEKRDTTGKCSVRILDEDDSILYSGKEITGGVDPQEFDIDVTGIDKIKFEFIITEGSMEVGVYDVIAH